MTRGGPADHAQIQPGDIITAIAGTQLRTVEDLFTQLRRHRPGQSVKVELLRNGNRKTADVLLSAKSQ